MRPVNSRVARALPVGASALAALLLSGCVEHHYHCPPSEASSASSVVYYGPPASVSHGYVYHYYDHDVTLVFDGDFYLTPRPDGKVLLGSTVEFASFDRGTTAEGVAELLQKGLSAAPGLRKARFVTAWAGLRPYAGREQPVLGPLPDHEEVVLATGHFRTGISPALITGQLIADWITTRRTSIPLAALLPEE